MPHRWTRLPTVVTQFVGQIAAETFRIFRKWLFIGRLRMFSDGTGADVPASEMAVEMGHIVPMVGKIAPSSLFQSVLPELEAECFAVYSECVGRLALLAGVPLEHSGDVLLFHISQTLGALYTQA